MSTISCILIYASNGASVAKDGERFTSMSHGLQDRLVHKCLLEVRVDQDVETEKFEAAETLIKADPFEIRNDHGVNGEQGLNDDIVNA